VTVDDCAVSELGCIVASRAELLNRELPGVGCVYSVLPADVTRRAGSWALLQRQLAEMNNVVGTNI
jgi:hypothetical protein